MENETIEILHQVGWTIDREISVKNYECILLAENYTLNSLVKRLIKNIGGISVVLPFNKPSINFDFKVDKAVSKIYKDLVEDYEKEIGNRLIPVGEYENYMTILICNSGVFYGGYSETLVKFGNNIDEALDTLCRVKDYGLAII